MLNKYDYETVKNMFNEKGYILLEKSYKNPKTKMKIKDENGYKYSQTLTNLQKGRHFNRFNKFNPYTIENIQLWLDKNAKGYKIVSNKYLQTHSKLEFKCNEGHLFQMAFADLQQGQRCSKCKYIKNGNRCRSTFRDVNAYVESIGYTLISKAYVNNMQKMDIKCNKCHVFKMSLNKLKRGQRCPYCNGSGGEKIISKYLDENNIAYKKEYSFNDLRDKNYLRFDFAIFVNEELYCLIEFDGEQHFKPKNWGGCNKEEAIEKFEDLKYKDKLKDEYCKENNIKLYRVHYTQVNDIDEILKKIIPR